MKRLRIISVITYIAMGLMIVMAIRPLMHVAPHGMLTWMLIGRICYTGGVIFYVWKRLPYHHAIWHLFVLTGSICHFFGLLRLGKS